MTLPALPGLLCFWDFREPAGADRSAQGPHACRLREQSGPIERVAGGPCSGFAARLREGQWFVAPRAEAPALDIHGPNRGVTVAAWLVRQKKETEAHCEFVAGQWDETRRKRQYGLFLNLHIWDSREQVCAHVSRVGGPTEGYKYCMDAAIGATGVTLNEWHCIGMTFDGTFARAYLDGRLDAREKFNPYRYEGGLFDGGPDGADFTVGSVNRSGVAGNWFVGLLGGLAVYDRALSEEEMAALAR